ncbi:MAG: aminoacyl-tRNA hydrolase [Candidatus Omnitrophica bacterium]|nr:aminoacyl-tRNA hydrolase [Candidatus Omnitrophota bacterium]MCM8800379.1 aminoacyl-tRNA hydrolase [Candidatus Omnitrophota bacterium]
MKLIVGLGNPGLIYRKTRHNVGKEVIESFAKDCKIKLKRSLDNLFCVGKATLEKEDFILAYPLVFMNISGRAVKALINRYKIDKKNLLVVCDDIDLPLGKIRLRPKGSDGGHKGLRSIIEGLKTEDFARLRIGIGKVSKEKVKDYVLSKFNREEYPIIEEAKERAKQCCQVWIAEGIQKAMNRFN